MSNREETIVRLVEKVLNLNINTNFEENLIDNGMDSVKVIQLLVELEENFNIEFADEDLQMKYFVSVKEILKLVSKKLNKGDDEK